MTGIPVSCILRNGNWTLLPFTLFPDSTVFPVRYPVGVTIREFFLKIFFANFFRKTGRNVWGDEVSGKRICDGAYPVYWASWPLAPTR